MEAEGRKPSGEARQIGAGRSEIGDGRSGRADAATHLHNRKAVVQRSPGSLQRTLGARPRSRLMEYGDSSPLSSAPRSAPTVRGPPRLAPAPFVVRPSGGLCFPAEAGTPAGSSHLEQATGRPRRSTLRVDSVGRVHNSGVGTHRCGHNPPVSPEGTSLSKPRVEPMRGTSEAQPWVTRTTQNRSPKGWPLLSLCQHRTENCLCSTSSITSTSTSTSNNFAVLLVLSFSGARTRNRNRRSAIEAVRGSMLAQRELGPALRASVLRCPRNPGLRLARSSHRLHPGLD